MFKIEGSSNCGSAGELEVGFVSLNCLLLKNLTHRDSYSSSDPFRESKTSKSPISVAFNTRIDPFFCFSIIFCVSKLISSVDGFNIRRVFKNSIILGNTCFDQKSEFQNPT